MPDGVGAATGGDCGSSVRSICAIGNRVVLDIVADPGPGNLLGNLLCLIAGLLDDVDLSTVERLKLANFLNRVLGLL